MSYQQPAVEQQARVQILKDDKDGYAVTGERPDEIAHLAPDEQKFINDKIKRQNEQAWGVKAKAMAKARTRAKRARRQQSADSA